MADDRTLPFRRPTLVVVAVAEDRVVYDPRRRQAHLLNLTAGLVLDACDGQTTMTELSTALADRFGIDETTVEAEVEAALAEFRAQGLVIIDADERDDIDERNAADERPPPPATPAGRRPWAAELPPLDLLGTVVQVRVEDPVLASVAAAVLAPLIDTCSTARPPTLRLDQVAHGADTVLLRDDREAARTDDPALALQHLLWELNQQAVDGTDDAVLLHAAAVQGPAGIAVLPAESDSGKSTLAAGLVRAGLSYLTDEAVGIDLQRGGVRVYPRAIGLGPGSWSLFPEAAPPPGAVAAGFFVDEWHVDPRRLHPRALDGLAESRHTPITVVAFPAYDPHGATHLEPLDHAAALALLLHNAFNLTSVSEPGVRVLDRLAADALTVRLVTQDLEEAVSTVATLLGASTVAGR